MSAQAPGAWARWVGLLSAREAPHSLAAFRVGVGLCLWHAFGSPLITGTWSLIWVDVDHGGYRPLGGGWLVSALGGPTPAVIGGLLGLGLLLGLNLVVGFASRLSAFAALQVFLAITNLNGHTGGSYDALIPNLLWLLTLADSGAGASVDAWLRARWASPPTTPVRVSAWPRYLVIGQLLTMYCSSGLQKVGASWIPGGDLSALYYILQQPTWQRFDMRWAGHIFPLTQLATLATWLFEVGAPALILVLWWRRTRARPGRLRALANRLRLRDAFVLFGLGLHIGIMSLMEVGPFSTASMACYACLLHPEEWAALLRRLRPSRGPIPA
ncbi:MAG: HTTM domain-containing protein [Deltaproteobacteria bacterium]|nr:HTTM domain-containing protein [Deltaproteobacteria bacterium]